MKPATYETLCQYGFKGNADTAAKDVIYWLSESKILRIEPYWRFLGCTPGYTWSKSWEVFSPKYEVECETWDELLEVALDRSVAEAL